MERLEMQELALSKQQVTSQYRGKLSSEPAGSFSAFHEGQNGNAAVIIYSFIVCGAFCWTAIKAHQQTYSKLFWQCRSLHSNSYAVQWCQAVACCNWLEITSCHYVPFPFTLQTCVYFYPPLLNQRDHLLLLKNSLIITLLEYWPLKHPVNKTTGQNGEGMKYFISAASKEGKNIIFLSQDTSEIVHHFPHKPDHGGMLKEDSPLWISTQRIRSQGITFWIKHGASLHLWCQPEVIQYWMHTVEKRNASKMK